MIWDRVKRLFATGPSIAQQKREILDYMEELERNSQKLIAKNRLEVRDGELYMATEYQAEEGKGDE